MYFTPSWWGQSIPPNFLNFCIVYFTCRWWWWGWLQIFLTMGLLLLQLSDLANFTSLRDPQEFPLNAAITLNGWPLLTYRTIDWNPLHFLLICQFTYKDCSWTHRNKFLYNSPRDKNRTISISCLIQLHNITAKYRQYTRYEIQPAICQSKDEQFEETMRASVDLSSQTEFVRKSSKFTFAFHSGES